MPAPISRALVPAVLASIVALALSPPAALAQADVVGQWKTLPYLTPINPMHVTLLPTGKILIASGSENDETQTVYRAAVYDPNAAIPFRTQNVAWDLFCNAMSQLPDGRILIVGGNERCQAFEGIRTTTIFDPSTEKLIQVHDMAHGRWYPSNTAPSDGRTMTIGGFTETGTNDNTVELDQIGAGWSPEFPVSTFSVPTFYPRLYLLPSGKVFLSGSSKQSQFFDSRNQSWTPGPTQTYAPLGTTKVGERRYGASVLLPLRPKRATRPASWSWVETIPPPRRPR